jgi:serine/threonine protein phosphatase PrpC
MLERANFDPSSLREKAPKPFFLIAETTEPSPRHPERNEDAFFVDGKAGLIILADGAGGQGAGNKMSNEVVRLAVEEMSRASGRTVKELGKAMEKAFRLVLRKGREASVRISAADVVAKRSGGAMATLTLAKFLPEANGSYSAVVMSVGDSPAFLCRADGRVERVGLPEDDILNAKIAEGELTEEEAKMISETNSIEDFGDKLIAGGFSTPEVRGILRMKLSELQQAIRILEEEPNRPRDREELLYLAKFIKFFRIYFERGRSVITQAVGLPEDQIKVHSVFLFGLKPGDRLVIASDGIEGLTEKEILETLGREKDFQKQLEGLRQAAAARSADKNHLRAKPDDITVVGMEVPKIIKEKPEVKPRSLPSISKTLARALKITS